MYAHHIIMQLLFISGKMRKDMQVAMSFLMKQVKKPDEDDWEKQNNILMDLNMLSCV